MSKKGLLIVYSGPSGVGKGTVRPYFQDDPALNLGYSISMTTRAPRNGEQEGVHYFFVTKEEFEAAVERGELLEHAFFCGNNYGTPLQYVENLRNEGKNVMLEIDVQGMEQVVEKCPEAITIFLVPPSMEELERRIRGRKTESEETIQERLAKAKKELAMKDNYKYVVCNDQAERAGEEIRQILLKEIANNK